MTSTLPKLQIESGLVICEALLYGRNGATESKLDLLAFAPTEKRLGAPR